MKMPVSVGRRLLPAVGILIGLCSIPVHAQDVAAIYKTKCAACHGADGKGESAMGKKLGVHDFAAPEVQSQSDDQLAAIINDGKNKMPGYKKSLKPDQVKELVEFTRSLAKK